jgi:hypothetical protein
MKRVFKGVFAILLIAMLTVACFMFNNTNVKGQKHIIIPVYAGLCDQMKYYICGKRLTELGYKVKYDISWYQGSCDEKATSPCDRTFQLLKAFPNIDFDIATTKEIESYKKKCIANPCNFDVNTWTLKQEPWKIGKYTKNRNTYMQCDINSWCVCVDILDLEAGNPKEEVLQKYLHISDDNYKVLDKRNREILERIQKSKCSVGVHVRRGDDATKDESHPIKALNYDYYVKVINAVLERYPDASFFFFSEEPLYIEQEILPKLPPNVKVEIVGNDANKCYMDLLLLAVCRHQIPSRGAMGAIAFGLNNHPDKELFGSNRTRLLPGMKLDVVVQEE